jgi:CSLREA domain-containing protein
VPPAGRKTRRTQGKNHGAGGLQPAAADKTGRKTMQASYLNIIRAALLVTAFMLAVSTARAGTIIVNTTADGLVAVPPGQPYPCTLRDAITAANTNRATGGCVRGEASPVVDTILFLLGTGTPSIRLQSMLPPITEPVVIRGDSFGATRVELNGSAASIRAALTGQRAHGLFVATGASTIRNLVINRFNGNGIVLTKNSDAGHIEHFSPPEITDPSLPVLPPCLAWPAEPDCPGSGGSGADSPPSVGADARNRIIGCFIGTDASGRLALGNGSGLFTAGLVTTTNEHTIGGPAAAERNVISGNFGHGIILGGRGHWVRGNFIGTDVGGALPLGNQFDGVNVAGGQYSTGLGAIGANLNAADTQCLMAISSNGAVTNDRRECGNRIAFNQRNGVSGGYNYYTFLSNTIFANGSLGLDVELFGQTPNAAGGSRNFPAFTFLWREFNLQTQTFGSRVFGTLTNSFSQPVTLQFFHSPACDPSGHGEGQTYLGAITLPGNGAFSFFVPYTSGVITATATTLNPGTPRTSEFSACLPL